MGTINKPNLIVPLAASYNERGIAGITTTVTNSTDQRKINCFYEPTKNSITGGGSLSLTKRPGVTKFSASLGTSSQQAFAISSGFGNVSLNAAAIIFNTVGTDIRANSTVIFSSSPAGLYLPIYVDHTAISNVDTIVLQTPALGGGSQRTFYAASIAGWTEILDADFTANAAFMTGKMEHMDGYAFQMLTNNKIINSDLNSLANWTATNFITKQITQDYPKGLAKLKDKIIAFGERSAEVYYNAGNSTGSPLSGIKILSADVGLAYEHVNNGRYSAVVGNKLYFYGRGIGAEASGSIYMFDGSHFIKISTDQIDKILLNGGSGPAHIYSFGFYGKDALAVCLSNLQGPVGGTMRWLMYFPAWNDWFEWTSSVFSPINNGHFFLSTEAKEKVYAFNDTSLGWQDDGTGYQGLIQFTLPKNGPALKRMSVYGLIGDTARSAQNITVEFSDDDYQSWKSAGTIDMTNEMKMKYRGGAYRNRAVRLTSSTENLEFRLEKFIARVD